jgi:hypothetical protein
MLAASDVAHQQEKVLSSCCCCLHLQLPTSPAPLAPVELQIHQLSAEERGSGPPSSRSGGGGGGGANCCCSPCNSYDDGDPPHLLILMVTTATTAALSPPHPAEPNHGTTALMPTATPVMTHETTVPTRSGLPSISSPKRQRIFFGRHVLCHLVCHPQDLEAKIPPVQPP